MDPIGIAAASGIVAALGFIFLYLDKRRHGFWFWRRMSLRRNGLRGRGKVLNRIDRGQTHMVNRRAMHRYDVVLEITLESGDTFRAPTSFDALFPGTPTREGQSLPVLVDPADRQTVLIDFPKLYDEYDDLAARQRREAEDKQRALLEEQPPRE